MLLTGILFTQSRADSITHNRGHNLKTGALKIKSSSPMAQETVLSWGLAKGQRTNHCRIYRPRTLYIQSTFLCPRPPLTQGKQQVHKNRWETPKPVRSNTWSRTSSLYFLIQNLPFQSSSSLAFMVERGPKAAWLLQLHQTGLAGGTASHFPSPSPQLFFFSSSLLCPVCFTHLLVFLCSLCSS